MRRDMELVRRILIAVRDKEDLVPREISFDDVDPLAVAIEVERLHAVNLIDGQVWKSSRDYTIRVKVRDLTWHGHEFLDAMTKDGVWEKMKAKLSPAELATLPMKVIIDLSMQLALDYAKQKLGLGGAT